MIEKLELKMTAKSVSLALNAVVSEGVMCPSCLQKIETLPTVSESDFCSACHAAITQQLELIAEEIVKGRLRDKGLPADAIQIVKN